MYTRYAYCQIMYCSNVLFICMCIFEYSIVKTSHNQACTVILFRVLVYLRRILVACISGSWRSAASGGLHYQTQK